MKGKVVVYRDADWGWRAREARSSEVWYLDGTCEVGSGRMAAGPFPNIRREFRYESLAGGADCKRRHRPRRSAYRHVKKEERPEAERCTTSRYSCSTWNLWEYNPTSFGSCQATQLSISTLVFSYGH